MRTYIINGKEYTSVTSLIDKMFPFDKEGFARYCESIGYSADDVMALSALMGSKVSEWIDNSTKGLTELDSPAVGKTEENLYLAVQQFLKDFRVLQSEKTVYSDEFMYAGTFDGLVEYKNTTYLMDWKTYGAWKGGYKRDPKKIKKVKYQLSMYRKALGEELPLAVVVFKSDGTYEVEELEYTEEWKDKLLEI